MNGGKLLNFLKSPGSKIVAYIILCFAFVLGANAQGPINWTLIVSAKTVKAGEKVNAQLTANISEGWYIYSLTQPAGGPNATRITATSEQIFKLAGSIKAPPPKVKFDKNFGINTETYSVNVTFSIPLQVAADAQTGKQTLAINVHFQVCNETTCLPPKTVKVESHLEVALKSKAETNTQANIIQATATPSATPTPKLKDETTPQITLAPTLYMDL